MTVRQILEEWLKAHGYDGLCTTGCGCRIGDLMACDECPDNCEPGYKAERAYGDQECDIVPHKEQKGESER